MKMFILSEKKIVIQVANEKDSLYVKQLRKVKVFEENNVFTNSLLLQCIVYINLYQSETKVAEHCQISTVKPVLKLPVIVKHQK